MLVACGAAPAQVRPALLVWKVGLDDKNGPETLVETVLPATYRDRAVWRVVHRDAETGPGYDMYDVDQATILPLRTVFRQDDMDLELTFVGDDVKISRLQGTERKESEIRAARPMPEGPGLQVLLAALPLRPGYVGTFVVVDRWAVDDAARMKPTELRVVGRDEIDTPIGRCDVLEVRVAPRDGSFLVRAWVRVDPPRYALRMEYTRGDVHLRSEVTELLLGDRPACCR